MTDKIILKKKLSFRSNLVCESILKFKKNKHFCGSSRLHKTKKRKDYSFDDFYYTLFMRFFC